MIRSLARAIGRAIPAGLPIGGSDGPVAFSPASLFVGASMGGWYDVSDLSTLFQDTAGAVPVTAFGQFVGRINDKSGFGNHLISTSSPSSRWPTYVGGNPYFWTRGAEKLLNGDFLTATDWTLGAGWSISGGSLVGSSVAGNVAAEQTVSASTDSLYEIIIVVESISAGAITADAGITTTRIGLAGTYRLFTRCSVTSPNFKIFVSSAPFSGVIASVSFKEVSGFSGTPGVLFTCPISQTAISSGILTLPVPAYFASAMINTTNIAQTGPQIFGSNNPSNYGVGYSATQNRNSTLNVGAVYGTNKGSPTIPSGVAPQDIPLSIDFVIDPSPGSNVATINGVPYSAASTATIANSNSSVTIGVGHSFAGGGAHPNLFNAGLITGRATTAQDRQNMRDWLDTKKPPLPTNAATGGNSIVDSGGYRIHTFTSSGDFVALTPLDVEYLVVSGGGGGGRGTSTTHAGSGGGGGGLLSGTSSLGAATFPVVVGAGGAGGPSNGSNGSAGSVSSFNAVAPVGGGAGWGIIATPPSAGGSGGGGVAKNSAEQTAGIAGTSGQGFAGGSSWGSATIADIAAGGGGGAGAVGGNAALDAGGNGGIGASSSISGVATYYAGGGGGSVNDINGTPGTGGLGGGSTGQDGASAGSPVTAATANTGGGGGGTAGFVAAAAGGSGIVIIRYLIP